MSRDSDLGVSLSPSHKRTKCNTREEQACARIGKGCELIDEKAMCVGKKPAKCSAAQSEACSKKGKSCKLVGGKAVCLVCPIHACWKACREAEPDKKVLNVSCKASDMCACSYEDECLPSKCQDYCKVAVPHADSKKAVCRDNLCHCVAPPTRPPGACTQKACTKACQAAEPNKKILKASCPEADMCRCSYEDDGTDVEDWLAMYERVSVPNHWDEAGKLGNLVFYLAGVGGM
ncbi:hypothetical protein HPB51_026749 [Rhipicephalus microplus]|uniref:Uncharacterized protein n=1 Tax=Rhipicephalus microplus TaxID=6941 RepID=A0A9J6D2A8_RHIMP|nr:hypothetical protein HPB51_026749 [Rhipicephalus microplus]